MNWAFFVYFGSSIYWESFNSGFLKIWRLILCTVLIFIFRRLPAVVVFRNWITPIRFFKETIYVGWFGPIGVGAMWYVALALDRLHIEPYIHDGDTKKDNDTFLMYYSSITFIVLCSIILHGVTVPLAHMTLTYTTRSLAKKEAANATWPKNMPIDGNIISGPISTLDPNLILKKKEENAINAGGEMAQVIITNNINNGEITDHVVPGKEELLKNNNNPNSNDTCIEMNESTAVDGDFTDEEIYNLQKNQASSTVLPLINNKDEDNSTTCNIAEEKPETKEKVPTFLKNINQLSTGTSTTINAIDEKELEHNNININDNSKDDKKE